MNEVGITSGPRVGEFEEDTVSEAGTIRRQLLWASLFPLVFFGLLSILVTATALYQMNLKLISQRNSAQVQASADQMEILLSRNLPAQAVIGEVQADVGADQILFVSESGKVIYEAGSQLIDNSFALEESRAIINQKLPGSVLTTSPLAGDQVIISYARLPGTDQGLVMVERWSTVMTSAFYYQLILVVLLVAGTVLSLVMLSVSIGTVIAPISDLARSAVHAVPGSIFHPLPERGPSELRLLTASFNQMVIRLAEQQSTLRQYAQKALLSQEEERQRLSHELHDGTVQDLVGLVQRIELCRNELDRDPQQARRRLDELKTLAGDTLNEVRNISNALRPSIFQDLGLSAALQALCSDLESQMPSLHCIYQMQGSQCRLQPEMELAVFRVAQEALTNIRKHAPKATQVNVEIAFCENSIQLTVKDNGPGMRNPDLGSLVRNGHLGYAGMYERTRLFGGKLDVATSPDTGTTIRMELPFETV